MSKRILQIVLGQLILGILLAGGLMTSTMTHAQEEYSDQDQQEGSTTQNSGITEHQRGRIVEAGEPQIHNELGFEEIQQTVKVEVLSGPQKGEVVSIEAQPINVEQAFKVGNTVVLERNTGLENSGYYIRDYYRLPWVIGMTIIFLVIAIIIGRKKGFGAVIGLVISIAILALYIVPKLAAGQNPVVVILVGATAITVIAFYISHGINRHTSIALVSTLATLVLAVVLSYISVAVAHLFGLGSEAAFYLQINPDISIDVRGLLLAGIIVGTLGVLDDVTINQVSIVRELNHANSELSKKELYTRALRVGKDHIASLINTLALAYAGTSLPLFLVFTTSNILPFWVILNEEYIAEELVRTLVGSTTLILAVPISTAIAVAFHKKLENNEGENHTHSHKHSH